MQQQIQNVIYKSTFPRSCFIIDRDKFPPKRRDSPSRNTAYDTPPPSCDTVGAFHLMAWPVRPEFFSLYQWKDLVYVSQISSENGPHILILSKFSGQIGRKPKRFVFHSTI
jgi:hypothetical protein